jgi:hypothetical protein
MNSIWQIWIVVMFCPAYVFKFKSLCLCHRLKTISGLGLNLLCFFGIILAVALAILCEIPLNVLRLKHTNQTPKACWIFSFMEFTIFKRSMLSSSCPGYRLRIWGLFRNESPANFVTQILQDSMFELSSSNVWRFQNGTEISISRINLGFRRFRDYFVEAVWTTSRSSAKD